MPGRRRPRAAPAGSRELWGARASDWAEHETQYRPVYDQAVGLLGIGPGTTVLDVGCGSGAFLRAAADSGAGVCGLDASAALLELARARVPEADLRLGDLQFLPYRADAFDVVTSFNSFWFGADPIEALREAGRVAKPGAPVLTLVWGRPERCELSPLLEAVAPAVVARVDVGGGASRRRATRSQRDPRIPRAVPDSERRLPAPKRMALPHRVRLTAPPGQHSADAATGAPARRLAKGRETSLALCARATQAPPATDRGLLVRSAEMRPAGRTATERCFARVGGADARPSLSRYLVDRIEQHERITVRTGTEVIGGDGRDRLEGVAIAGAEGEQTLATDALFVLIGAEPLTAGVADWLRCDDRGYFMPGPDLLQSSDRSWWPLERDPLFLESSQPGVFVAGDVRHGSIKRVASAVGEGAMAASLVHTYLAARRSIS